MKSTKPYNGIFFPRDSEQAGHLSIAGADTLLNLASTEHWEHPPSEYHDIHGRLTDGRKASLLQCISAGQINHRWGEDARYESNFFPHYVVLGEQFVTSSETSIRAIHYHFENVDCLVHAYGSFQALSPKPNEVRKVLKAEHLRGEKIAKEHGWETRPFNPQIGEYPHLLYYSGVWEIVRFETEIATVTMNNRTTHGSGSSKGIGIENQITVSLVFHEPKTVHDAINSLITLHSLFELSLGRRQRYLWIELALAEPGVDPEGRSLGNLELFWSYCNERVEGETERTHIGNVLISPDMQPEEFIAVASGWMDSAPTMSNARTRFGTAFHSSYSIDRIVGAANMFDLLPDDRAPKKKEPDIETKVAAEQCKKIFKALPHSFAKQSVLSALGRVGTASLRDKVLHRASVLSAASGNLFPDIHVPCSQAVLCRNHYVHGSDPEFDYREEFGAFAFLTNTLEFVFAASDLIELGWDFIRWRDKGLGSSHDFGTYVYNYAENLTRLNAIISADAQNAKP